MTNCMSNNVRSLWERSHSHTVEVALFLIVRTNVDFDNKDMNLSRLFFV
jgi:hypothetical protein